MQLKEKPELNQINQELEELEFWAKTYQPDRLIKKRESAIAILLKIIFIYFPLGLIFFVFVIYPSFLMCNPGNYDNLRKSEGKQFVASMNKAQQAKYAEDGTFSNSIDDLGIGIKTQTTNYNYSTIATKNSAFSYAVPLSERKNFPSYVGAVFLVVSPAANNEKITTSILCEVKSSGNIQPPNPILQNGVLVCAAGSSPVVR